VRAERSPARLLTREEAIRLLSLYPWPVEEALLVIYGPTPPNPSAPQGFSNGESAGDFSVVSNGNYGGFQINEVHASKTPGGTAIELLIPAVNVDVAFQIYSDQGWAPWSCRP
jgi:hypothetical protein